MKKFMALATAAVMATSVTAFAAEGIQVTVNGEAVSFEAQQPLIKDDRTLVPLRGIFEAMDATVTWEQENQTITSVKGEDTVVMRIGSKEMTRNGEAKELDVAPELIDGSTMVPVRAIAESFGSDVAWDEESKTVVITEKTTAPSETEEGTTPEEGTQPSETPAGTQTDNGMNIPANTANGLHKITSKTIEETVKADDETVVINAKANYPEIENPGNSIYITKMNESFQANAEKAVKDFIAEAGEGAKALYAEKGAEFLPYEFSVDYRIPYDKSGKLSVVYITFQDTAGAHPNTVVTSEVYDFTSGSVMDLSDITVISPNQINKLAEEAFMAQIKAEPEKFLEDAKTTLSGALKDAGYYLTDDGLCVYFNPYVISPYVSGVVSVNLDVAVK